MNILKKLISFPNVVKQKPEVLKSLIVLPKDEKLDRPVSKEVKKRGCGCGS